jgi:hypothetical protein
MKKVFRRIVRINKLRATGLLVLSLFISLFAKAQIDPAYKVFYGLLHAHTLISDGSGVPEEAYAMAKANGLQFFAVTPHNHADAEDGAKERKDGVLIALNHALYNGTTNVTVTRHWNDGTAHTETISVKPLIKAAKDATTANFLALYGQEFSTISKGNHVNVFGDDNVIESDNGDFRGLLALLKGIEQSTGRTPVLQLNHPDVQQDLFYHGTNATTIKNMFNDYGIDEGDLGPDFKDLVKAMSPYAHLIEVLSGPAMKKAREVSFKYDPNENDYFFYLKQGFHLSPSAGQDNHYKTWGAITDARTGIVSKTLTEAALFEAIRKNRTFATEDKNLKVILYLNDSIMGSSVTAPAESELHIKILIEDADEPQADYEVSIFGGKINPEPSKQATDWKQSDGLFDTINVKGNGIYNFPGVFADTVPSFYYAKIVQENGDRAWTAPVWVNENPGSTVNVTPAAKFFWTSSPSSTVYHIAGCSAIDRIKPENLMSGQTPPPGRTQHNCKVDNSDTH